MKRIFESWRKYVVNEGKPIVDIRGKGSNELGNPKSPRSIAYAIAKGLVTPCTSSLDPGCESLGEKSKKEEYEEWREKNAQKIDMANEHTNQYLSELDIKKEDATVEFETSFTIMMAQKHLLEQTNILNNASGDDNSVRSEAALRKLLWFKKNLADWRADIAAKGAPAELLYHPKIFPEFMNQGIVPPSKEAWQH